MRGSMTLLRTILALAITLSVAVLPAAGPGLALASTDMSDMPAMADNCCPHHPVPRDKRIGHCSSMAACPQVLQLRRLAVVRRFVSVGCRNLDAEPRRANYDVWPI
jgi:hypothetical protein